MFDRMTRAVGRPHVLFLVPILILAGTAQAGFMWGGIVEVHDVVGLADGSLLVVTNDELIKYPPNSSRPDTVLKIPVYSSAHRPLTATSDGELIATISADGLLVTIEALTDVRAYNLSDFSAGNALELFAIAGASRIVVVATDAVFAVEVPSGAKAWSVPCRATPAASFASERNWIGVVCGLDLVGMQRTALVLDEHGQTQFATPPSDDFGISLSPSGNFVHVYGSGGGHLYRVPSPGPIWTDIEGELFVLGRDEAVALAQWAEGEPGEAGDVYLQWFDIPVSNGPGDPYAAVHLDGGFQGDALGNGELVVLVDREGTQMDRPWGDLPSGFSTLNRNTSFHRYDLAGQEVEIGGAFAGHRIEPLSRPDEAVVFVSSYFLALYRAGENNSRPMFGEKPCTLAGEPPAVATAGPDVADPDGDQLSILWNFTAVPDRWRSFYLSEAGGAEGPSVNLPADWTLLSIAAMDDRGAFSIVACDGTGQGEGRMASGIATSIVLCSLVAIFLVLPGRRLAAY